MYIYVKLISMYIYVKLISMFVKSFFFIRNISVFSQFWSWAEVWNSDNGRYLFSFLLSLFSSYLKLFFSSYLKPKLPHFRNLQDVSFQLVLSWKNFPSQKSRGEENLAVFGQFLCPHRKNFNWLSIGQYWRQWGCLWLIWKLMSSIFQNTCESCRNLKKIGCCTPPKWGDPELCHSKTLFLGTF